MEYSKNIKMFEIRESINLPLKENPKQTANSSIGDMLICDNGKDVYAKHWTDKDPDTYVLLLNELSFFELNSNFFRPIK